MDTLQEALFKAMLHEGWFTDSDGETEFSLGYFGYVVNERADWNPEFISTFEDTIDAYSVDEFDTVEKANEWIEKNFVGVWFASINDQGIIRINKIGDYVRTPGVAALGIEVTPVVAAAQKQFKDSVRDYIDWSNDQIDDDPDQF